ncbi:Uracil-DNA glycosylase, family 4 [Minicystis rosea]|nr:Uracil-DNA glycosylase, family 4 [Minicystis rosea]
MICKATFALMPGELRLTEEQDDPNEDENFWDDDRNRSVYAPSDLAPFKVRADVVLVGKAFSPQQAPVRTLHARLSIGAIDKTVECCADRSWSPGGEREGAPFTSMWLLYERAAYGAENPAGVRFDPHAGGALPNLMPPGAMHGRRPEAIPPIGFGPIASQWPARHSKLGHLPSGYAPRAFVDVPIPDALDPAFFNVAPPDQQRDFFEPGERLVLENLSPKHPVLHATLPAARPRAFLDRGAGLEELNLLCDTLWIDTDRAVATLTWRAQIGLATARDEGHISVLWEHAGMPLGWDEIQRKCARGAPAGAPSKRGPKTIALVDPTTTLDRTFDDAEHTSSGIQVQEILDGGVLPFVASQSAAGPRSVAPSAPPWLEANRPVPRPEPGPTETRAIAVKRWAPPGATMPPSMPPSSLPATPPAPPAPPMVAPPLAPPAPPMVAPPLAPPAPPMMAPPMVAPLASAPSLISAVMPSPLVAPVTAPPLAEPAPASPPRAAARAAPGEIIDLLGFDPKTPDRARMHQPWQELIARLRPPPDLEDPDDDTPEDPPEVAARRDVLGVLTEADRMMLDDLDAALEGATSPEGALTPPLVLFAGDLEMRFDEVEALQAALAAVAPFTSGPDKRLKDAFDSVVESLKSPWVQGSHRAAEALQKRLSEAFAQGAWQLPQGWLDQQVERTLVEKRAYQKRKVFGQTWLVASLSQRGGTAQVPTYLPEDLGGHLPLYARFPVRIMAEAHLQQDQYESHPYALRTLALARVATPPKAAPRASSRLKAG